MRSPATCRSCCCRSATPRNIDLVRQLVQAHAYWRLKGLAVDLVIWNEDRAGYRQRLQDQIMGLIAAGIEAHVIDRPGGIFVRRAEQIVRRGPRAAAVGRARRSSATAAARWPSRSTRRAPRDAPRAALRRARAAAREPRAATPAAAPPRRAATCSSVNGLGGFSADGREYVITPAPAQRHAGAVGQRARQSALRHASSPRAAAPTPGARTRTSSASRPGTTIRSATRAARRSTCATRRPASVWSPTPLPRRRRAAPYVTRHGFGYSVFEHDEDGIRTELRGLRRARRAGEVLAC